MLTKLHANATTTPKTRAYIQASQAPVAVLAAELGVSETTIRRWQGRSDTADHSHRPLHLQTRFDAIEEEIAVELRTRLGLSLDDSLEVMQRCLRPDISRSALHRCLKRHGVSGKTATAQSRPVRFATAQPAGFIHMDVKYLTPLGGRRSYAYVAIDRATRFVYLEVLPDRKATTGAAFLKRFLEAFPLKVHTILTDNGVEFTDRFADDKPQKPKGQPSGQHPFDKVCSGRAIRHLLARPYRPQTNGLVERFNRRLAEAIAAHPPAPGHQGKNRFASHRQRDDFLHAFVNSYNKTRLRCLAYKAPRELLDNLSGHNTKAGVP
ncbi:MAG: transposase [Rhizobiales bacterium]|nr:transposase [Hyphomicrobiales bacterium]